MEEEAGSDGGEDADGADDEEEDLVVQVDLEVGRVEGGARRGGHAGEVEPGAVDMVEDELGHGDGDDAGAGGDRGHYADEERDVVAAADTVVQPFTVVVELADALVADAAVLGPAAGSLDVTQVTSAVLDDVRVLRAVELRHEVRALESTQGRVRRVQQEGGQVRHEVQQEETHQDGEEQGSERVAEGRDEDEEDGRREDEEREPARDLLRVQRKLEAVQTPPLPVLRGGQARVGRAHSQHSPAITDTCRSRRSRLATDYRTAGAPRRHDTTRPPDYRLKQPTHFHTTDCYNHLLDIL